MDGIGLLIFGAAGFVMAVFSGMAGTGGGFIMAPLAILLGLTPAQSVSTSKLSGITVAVGALCGMRRVHEGVSSRKIMPVLFIAFLVGLGVPLLIKGLGGGDYRFGLIVVLLCMIPVVLNKDPGTLLQSVRSAGRKRKLAGGGLLTVSMTVQGVFGGGTDSLVNIVLMKTFGMSVTHANIVKRWAQLVMNLTIVIGVIGSGLIVWNAAAVGMVTTLVGSYIGGNLALIKSEVFIRRVMAAMMLSAAVALVVAP